jgi:hypothetical protein
MRSATPGGKPGTDPRAGRRGSRMKKREAFMGLTGFIERRPQKRGAAAGLLTNGVPARLFSLPADYAKNVRKSL